jgi:hypothetical protein
VLAALPARYRRGIARGRAGTSHLILAGAVRLLFDTGLSGARAESALRHNAELLRVDLRALDAVVISRLHADHVGGVSAMRQRTFAFAAEPLEPAGAGARPDSMQHRRADVVHTTGPTVIAPGVAMLSPVPRMMFWLGDVAEQALVVNVRGPLQLESLVSPITTKRAVLAVQAESLTQALSLRRPNLRCGRPGAEASPALSCRLGRGSREEPLGGPPGAGPDAPRHVPAPERS